MAAKAKPKATKGKSQARKPATNRKRAAPANRDDQGRFVPGASGNPAGRPKGVSLAWVLSRVLTEAEAERIVKAVIAQAKRGNMTAWQSLIDRTDGRVPQRTTIDGGDDDDGNQRPVPIRLLPPLDG